MSNQVKAIATAQGVGSSAAVICRATPFVEGDSALAIIQPAAGNDRTWTLEKSEDDGASWVTTGITGNNAVAVFTEVQIGDQMRLTVAGGTAGTVTAMIVA